MDNNYGAAPLLLIGLVMTIIATTKAQRPLSPGNLHVLPVRNLNLRPIRVSTSPSSRAAVGSRRG
jgi:hypothetical protein